MLGVRRNEILVTLETALISIYNTTLIQGCAMDLGQEQEGLWGTQWAQEGTLTWAKAGR